MTRKAVKAAAKAMLPKLFSDDMDYLVQVIRVHSVDKVRNYSIACMQRAVDRYEQELWVPAESALKDGRLYIVEAVDGADETFITLGANFLEQTGDDQWIIVGNGWPAGKAIEFENVIVRRCRPLPLPVDTVAEEIQNVGD